MNCLKNMVIWYEDHKNRCPYEPHLAELDPTFGLYTTAVWQCEAGHRYFQDLHSPLKPLSDSENDSDDGQGRLGMMAGWGAGLQGTVRAAIFHLRQPHLFAAPAPAWAPLVEAGWC